MNQAGGKMETVALKREKTENAYAEESRSKALKAKNAFRLIRTSPSSQRNAALLHLADILSDASTQRDIQEANKIDLENAGSGGLSSAMIDRLRLNEKGIASIINALREIAAFPDPVGEVIGGRTLASGVRMVQKRVPLGVVFTVFESRPNVTVDIGALCLKAGNAAILRGGREALNTNLVLYRAFQKAIGNAGLPEDALLFIDNPDRDYMLELLKQDAAIDLVVPRGGEALIKFVTANSRIPVIKHDKGVCNLFIDESADLSMALDIAINAKLQKPSVCNAVENLLIHSNFKNAGQLLSGLKSAGAELHGCTRSRALSSEVIPIENEDEEYAMEYLDNRLSVKVVDSVEEAVSFIHRYGSSHSEAIVSENKKTIESFSAGVDSAAVFINCSTRFHDGGQMGMGAEVGISTQRLHVRGPMGVRDLTTTTYVMTGDGQIRK